MENQELISIIVPAFNVEKYVRRTLKSILRQTYSNIEVICVDDGSTDATLDAIRSISAVDERIKVFSKQNEGVTLARRYGFEQSRGEYIGFVDADDEIEPTMFERLYNNLIKYKADISHCGHDIVWLSGKKENFYGTGHLAQQDKISGLKSLISGSFEPGLCNKLYKHTLLQSLFHSGAMDYSIKINEDLLMNYYLFKQAENTVLEDVCLYHYLKREGSASSSAVSHKFIWDQIQVKQLILNDSEDTEYETDARKAYLITCLVKYNALVKLDNKSFDDDIKPLRSLIAKQKDSFHLLNQKQRVGAKLLISKPALYNKLAKKFL